MDQLATYPNLPPLLKVQGLTVEFGAPENPRVAVADAAFTVAAGETVCLVGESGSGKTVTAQSLLRLDEFSRARIVAGEIEFDGSSLLSLTRRQLNDLRGKRIGMVFQEPATAFDPLFSIGDQLIETILRHRVSDRAGAHAHAVQLLARVHIPDPRLRMKQIPQQLSGGMRQRAMIAMALAGNPQLLIADEPTTALDVTIQAQILALLKELQREDGLAILLITHDLAVAAEMADRVVVMYAGRVVEQGPVEELFADPRHPYTRGLLRSSVPPESIRGSRLAAIPGAIPQLDERLEGCRFHPRCPLSVSRCRTEMPPAVTFGGREVACWRAFDEEPRAPAAADALRAADVPRTADALGTAEALRTVDPVHTAADAGRSVADAQHTAADALHESAPLIEAVEVSKYFDSRAMFGRGVRVHALDGVSLAIRAGETFGLVGESGCGKSTLGRVLLQLEPASSGTVRFEGRDLSRLCSSQRRLLRRDMQMIFQDPYGSIDPRWTVNDIIAEPLVSCGGQRRAGVRARVAELLTLVGLDPKAGNRHVHEFSGGQRQRIGIARAIATNPKFILADEPVSALDLSIQAQIINLLAELKQRLGLTCLFIGHGLNVVRHLSDRVGVMYFGRLVEVAPADLLFRAPAHHYSRALIDAIPVPDPRRRWQLAAPIGELPSPAAPPSGCHFHPRCAAATSRCRSEVPPLQHLTNGRSVACHHPRD